MKKTLYQRVAMYFLATFVFFLPLIFSSQTNELYEFPKTLALYVGGTVLIGLFAAKWIWNPGELKRPSLLIVFFLLVNVVATLLSVDKQTSFWGYYTRFNGGLMSTLICFGIYLVSINSFTRDDFLKLIVVSVLSVVPVSVYGVLQHYGLGHGTAIERVYSTFGQPNWLAQFITMQFFLVLYFFYRAQERRIYFWGFLALVGFACLWFTYSLSGLLAFLIGFTVFSGMHREFVFKKYRARTLFLFFAFVLIAGVNLGMFRNRVHDAFIDVSRWVSEVSRVYAVDATYIVSDPGYIRKGLWEGTWLLITSTPKIFLIGTGPETFPFAFQRFRPSELNFSSEWNFVFNKPHNYYLQLWSEIGLVGLVSYVLILVRISRKAPTFLFPSVAAFFITNLFGWPVVVTSLTFWIWLAYLEVQN